MAKAKEDVSAVNQRMIEHNILKRDFEINQQLYESLLQRLERCHPLRQLCKPPTFTSLTKRLLR